MGPEEALLAVEPVLLLVESVERGDVGVARLERLELLPEVVELVDVIGDELARRVEVEVRRLHRRFHGPSAHGQCSGLSVRGFPSLTQPSHSLHKLASSHIGSVESIVNLTSSAIPASATALPPRPKDEGSVPHESTSESGLGSGEGAGR